MKYVLRALSLYLLRSVGIYIAKRYLDGQDFGQSISGKLNQIGQNE